MAVEGAVFEEEQVIEAAPERPARSPRLGERILSKLDEVLEAVHGGDAGDEGEERGEVTFEPEPTQLPVTPESNDPDAAPEGTGDAGTGEGTANVGVKVRQRRFMFPHRPRGMTR